ncbi:hypothetical protein GTY76_37600 [Streptomyces sp. SID4951]|nr:hypothetical protein [Streptomyces sp. SID4951]
MRAPKECGSWFWDLGEVTPPGLQSALRVAARMAEVLNRFDLLTPVSLECKWYVRGSGFTGTMSRVFVFTPLDDPSLPDKVLGSQPASFPDSKTNSLQVIGSGTWFDAEGKARKESRLVDLSVTTGSYGPTATLSVHHDIWGSFDFFGRPHHEVQTRNAPRLADALRGLNTALGVAPELGEPTYFGVATEFGIAAPDADEDGLGPDLTDKL